ncbi:unnamed protein product [Sphagnum jensenii]
MPAHLQGFFLVSYWQPFSLEVLVCPSPFGLPTISIVNPPLNHRFGSTNYLMLQFFFGAPAAAPLPALGGILAQETQDEHQVLSSLAPTVTRYDEGNHLSPIHAARATSPAPVHVPRVTAQAPAHTHAPYATAPAPVPRIRGHHHHLHPAPASVPVPNTQSLPPIPMGFPPPLNYSQGPLNLHNVERGWPLSASAIFTGSGRYLWELSDSFRRHSASGPLKTTGDKRSVWYRLRGANALTKSDHGAATHDKHRHNTDKPKMWT